MTHRVNRFLSALLAAALVVLGSLFPAAAAPPVEPDAVALEFVFDSSGSVEDPEGGGIDPEGLRFDAAELLLDQFPADYPLSAGAVLFSTNLLCDAGLRPVLSPLSRSELIQILRSAPSGGWTNLGAGLETAVDALCSSSAPLRACVIATDGRILCGSEDATQASLQAAEQAAARAKEAGITLYGLYLNFNGQADPRGLEQLRQLCHFVHEVDSLADLDAACASVYNGVTANSDLPVPTPVDMPWQTQFRLPDGLDAARILVSSTQIGQADLTLSDPSGAPVSPKSLSELQTRYTRTVEIGQPSPGLWQMTLNGPSGSTAAVQMVFEANLWAGLRCTEPNAAGQAAATVWLEDDQRRPIDLTGYSAVLQIQDPEGTLLSQQDIPADAMTGTEVTLPVTLPKEGGTLSVTFRFGDQLSLTSQPLSVSPAPKAPFPLPLVLLAAAGVVLAVLAWFLLGRRSGGPVTGALRLELMGEFDRTLCVQELELDSLARRTDLLQLAHLVLSLSSNDLDQDPAAVRRAKDLVQAHRTALKKAVLTLRSRQGETEVRLNRQPCAPFLAASYPPSAPVLRLTYLAEDPVTTPPLPDDEFDPDFHFHL